MVKLVRNVADFPDTTTGASVGSRQLFLLLPNQYYSLLEQPGELYPSCSLNYIAQAIANPPVGNKGEGESVIFTEYRQHDARSFDQQYKHGTFYALAGDIDTGNYTLDAVSHAITEAFGPVTRGIYSTHSSTQTDKRWRYFIPLQRPVTGQDYSILQRVMFEAMGEHGIECDSSMARTAAIMHLPLIPSEGAYYEYMLTDDPTVFFNPFADDVQARMQKLRSEMPAVAYQRSKDAPELVQLFNQQWRIEELLQLYKYRQKSINAHNWRSPYQTTNSYATKIFYDDQGGEYWISLSDSDRLAGVGRMSATGNTHGDAFDLVVHYGFGGDIDAAVAWAMHNVQAPDGTARTYGVYVNEGIPNYAETLSHIRDKALAPAVTEVQYIPEGKDDFSLLRPPGLLGDLAEFIYHASIRPVWEVSMAAAIGFMSGICARSYNINHSGLAQYILLLAETGRGKEGAQRGIATLFRHLYQSVPGIKDHFGPSEFASASSLHREISEAPCMVSVIGEFGLLYQSVTSVRAGTNEAFLLRLLLDVFGKTGSTDELGGKAYADKAKSYPSVQSPNLTILGESVPDVFFDSLEEGSITGGLMPRFTVMQYTGERPARNMAPVSEPSEELLARIRSFVQCAMDYGNKVNTASGAYNIPGVEHLDHYDREIDDKLNCKSGDKLINELYNRAHLKALRFAGLIAVGIDPYNPVVTKEIADMAIQLTEAGIAPIMRAFHADEFGSGNHRQRERVLKVIERFMHMTPAQRKSNQVGARYLEGHVVPLNFISKYTRRNAAFTNDKMGANSALKNCLNFMCEAGELVKVPPSMAKELYGRDTGTLYYLPEAQ